MSLEQFVAALAAIKPPPNVCNQYSYHDPFAPIRRQNLRLHWQQLQPQQPTVLLLGEAVGYRGGRLTGLPFVSEQIMLNHPLFGVRRGFAKTAEWPAVCGEATATMMWQTLDARQSQPVLWNVFPFHPHQPHKPASNRKPTVNELNLGEHFVRSLLRLFPISIIVAVGNTAAATLHRWQLAHVKVRHPSHGGKRPFQAGLTAILDENS